MIKTKVGNTIILGFSDINIEKLKNNEPIIFNLKDAGIEDIDSNIMIFHSRSDESVRASLLMMVPMMENIIKTDNDANFMIGKYSFNQNQKTLTLNSIERKLTNKETQLLRMLCMNTELDRNIALKEIWRDINYFNSRSMDVYIAKLRGYLKQDSSVEIANIHGIGFKLKINKNGSA